MTFDAVGGPAEGGRAPGMDDEGPGRRLRQERSMAGVDILATAMTGANAAFLADLYARWVERPDSVDASFADLFAALNDDARAVLTDAVGASWAPRPRGGFAPEPRTASSSPRPIRKPRAARCWTACGP
jgi:2-oxoglutarate dehydrogenase E1 component